MEPGQDFAPENGAIGIIGAGSLGRLWAGYLPPGSTIFLGRAAGENGEDALLAQKNMLHYDLHFPNGSGKSCSVPLRPITQAQPSLLLVTTKAGDTPRALEQLLSQLDKTVPLVLFQNGLGCQQAIADRWPDRPVLAASTTEGANRPEDSIVVHAGQGETWVGNLTAAGLPWVASTVQRLSASGLVVHSERDIHQRLWDKLVVNAGINAFTAILDCCNGQIRTDPFFLEYIDPLSNEISAVMATEVRRALSPKAIRERIEAVATRTATNTSSMRSDCQRHRKTEINVINGYIVARGQLKGIATPVNQMLIRRVKEMTSD